MKILLLAFGKLKIQGSNEFVTEFLKRSSKWCEIEMIELRPETVPEKTDSRREQIQLKEAEVFRAAVKRHAPTRHALFLFDERGKSLPTREWAEWLKDAEMKSLGTLVLGIGSSLGFHASLRNEAEQVFSFGPQTFSHELARMVLVEQLYRALSYRHGHPYHNEG